MPDRASTRRKFLLTGLAAAGGAAGAAALRAPKQPTLSQPAAIPVPLPSEPAIAAAPVRELPTRVLGRTNVALPVLGLGGSASPLSRPNDEQRALEIIERAYTLGIRYFDTAANYGPSELRLGEVLPRWRSTVFLATKTSQRTYDEAWRQLERSLKRLRTETIDLWQFHALTHDWDLDTILDRRQGAIRAAEEAKEQNLVRHIGITGHHNPDIFVKALGRYPFATASIPVNAADVHTPRPFIRHVLPVARAQNTGIIAMKVPAYGRLLQPGILDGMEQAMGYALSQAGVHTCIIAAETIAQLEANVRAAAAFAPFSAAELTQLEGRTAAVWKESSFFRNWG